VVTLAAVGIGILGSFPVGWQKEFSNDSRMSKGGKGGFVLGGGMNENESTKNSQPPAIHLWVQMTRAAEEGQK
jgi:hypothetical protein